MMIVDATGPDDDAVLLREITLTNILSFGPACAPIQLQALNVVIGTNGSGKSNLLEAIDLLRSAPDKLADMVSQGGGVRDLLWKGAVDAPTASIDVVLNCATGPYLRYVLPFVEVGQRLFIFDERVENEHANAGELQPYFYYRFQNGRAVLNVKEEGGRRLQREEIDNSRSILSQRRDPYRYPEITFLAETLPTIRLYREWSFGRTTAPRMPQKADLPNKHLDADGRNLGLVLNRLRRDSRTKTAIVEALKKLYDGIDDFDVQVEGGTVQVFLHEDGVTIPATRLSDGTLRYLCLLAILCHPDPPPLVCIEEPELGLHPDVMPTIAELLRNASQRCQLVVTTHSDALVDALTDIPDSVLVCEKQNGATQLRRLSTAELQPWLERYRLGELWTRGDLGGTRW